MDGVGDWVLSKDVRERLMDEFVIAGEKSQDQLETKVFGNGATQLLPWVTNPNRTISYSRSNFRH